MSKRPTASHGVQRGTTVIHLSQLLGASVVTPSGEPIGQVDDIIVQLPSVDKPAPDSGLTIVWDQPAPREWTDGRRNRLNPK
jgi:hypothetical protein